jgi:hypothetical protein
MIDSMKLKTYYKGFAFCALVAAAVLGCQPDEFEDGNGLTSPDLAAQFTVTPVEGRTNTYLLKAATDNVLGVKWDKGDGVTAMGKTIDTVFYPDAGSYAVTLTTIGKGGALATATQTIEVATSDPVAGNLVVGGKMEAGDESKWTKLAIGGNSVAFNFVDGKLVATGGAWGHSGVYQAIDVVAGKKYKLDLTVSGSGATDTWFEVYLGKAEPMQGNDYSDGGIRIGLNTWNGCGKTTFSGKLSELSCAGSGNVVEFAESGKIYLLIKSGGADLGASGISIDNVELRGTN